MVATILASFKREASMNKLEQLNKYIYARLAAKLITDNPEMALVSFYQFYCCHKLGNDPFISMDIRRAYYDAKRGRVVEDKILKAIQVFNASYKDILDDLTIKEIYKFFEQPDVPEEIKSYRNWKYKDVKEQAEYKGKAKKTIQMIEKLEKDKFNILHEELTKLKQEEFDAR